MLRKLRSTCRIRFPMKKPYQSCSICSKNEGLCLGGSSGINVASAIRLRQELGPGHTIVTVLCDGGQRYQSKLFNPAFLAEKGLPTPDWL